jgi:hypothetical protein
MMMGEDTRLTSNKIECHRIAILVIVPVKAPIEIAPIASEGESARIKNVDLIALRRAKEVKATFHVLVGNVNAIERGVRVVINDDVLVWVLAPQLFNHFLSECRLGGVFFGVEFSDVDKFLKALLDKADETDNH